MFDFIPLDVNLTHAIIKLFASVHFGAFHEKVHLIVKHCLHHAKFFYCFTLFFFFHYALILLGKLQRHLKTQFFFLLLGSRPSTPIRRENWIFETLFNLGKLKTPAFRFLVDRKRYSEHGAFQNDVVAWISITEFSSDIGIQNYRLLGF